MADIPRFRKGNVGGLNFAQLNELLNRVDKAKPTTETSSIDRSADAATKPVRSMLVNATPSGTIGGVQQFDWEEIFLRGEYEDRQLPLDNPVDQSDGDYDFLKELSQTQIRSGSAADGNYAISLDPNFEGGMCFAMVMARTDGRKRYVLVPTVSASPQLYGYVKQPATVPPYLQANYPTAGFPAFVERIDQSGGEGVQYQQLGGQVHSGLVLEWGPFTDVDGTTATMFNSLFDLDEVGIIDFSVNNGRVIGFENEGQFPTSDEMNVAAEIVPYPSTVKPGMLFAGRLSTVVSFETNEPVPVFYAYPVIPVGVPVCL